MDDLPGESGLVRLTVRDVSVVGVSYRHCFLLSNHINFLFHHRLDDNTWVAGMFLISRS